MMNSHQTTAPGEWTLEAGQATRLQASSMTRWLVLKSGRAWLTRTGAGLEGEDLWLCEGERAPLPAGTEWVIEGDPHAQLMVLEAPQVTAPRFSPAAWWRVRRDALRQAWRPVLLYAF